MTGKTFVDTNILVYAHEVDAGQRHEHARETVSELWANRSGVLSPQVLQEFYVTVTRKIAQPLSKSEAAAIIKDFSAWCIAVTANEVSDAIRIEGLAKISFWDALIVAAALKAGATTILSEDMNAGQEITGIRIVNPFLQRI